MVAVNCIEIVCSVLESVNRGDLDAALEHVAADCPNNGRPVSRDDRRQRAEKRVAAIPDGQYVIRAMSGDGEKVRLQWEFRGTPPGPAEATLAVNGLSIFRIENDMVVEAWQHYHIPKALKDLGVDLAAL